MSKVGETLNELVARLRQAGIDNPRLDSRLLLAAAMGVDKIWLFSHPEAEIGEPAGARLAELAARRCRREPMSQILGRREFWSLDFLVTGDTLTPRPDSETVIEAVLEQIADRQAPLSLLDLGTGSGCLLLALLSELPKAQGLGIDRSPAALAVAAENAKRMGLADRSRFLCSDWCAAVTGGFDVILCNPPYIASGEIEGLEPEVARFEPKHALDGGKDGLDDYRRLAPQIAAHLNPAGIAAFEIGAGQAPEVAALLAEQGLALRSVRRDLGGIERCVVVAR